MNKCCICLAVLNCGPYINKVVKNCHIIGEVFDDYNIVFFYDKSNDNTLEVLKSEQSKCNKIVVLENKSPLEPWRTRTHKLALARNELVNYVRTNHSDYDFFIMMDADDVCATEPNMNVFKKYITRKDWDLLTFNREDYYDLWALSMPELVFSCWHFEDPWGSHGWRLLLKDKFQKCKKDELISVVSAFNGFGIYRTKKFEGATYSGYPSLELIPEYMIRNNIGLCGEMKPYHWDPFSECQDCEHRSFHMYARIMNDAQICICPEILFPEDP